MVFCLCLYVCACRESEIVCRSNYQAIKALEGRAAFASLSFSFWIPSFHIFLFPLHWDIFWLYCAHSLLSRASDVFENVHLDPWKTYKIHHIYIKMLCQAKWVHYSFREKACFLDINHIQYVLWLNIWLILGNKSNIKWFLINRKTVKLIKP